MTGADPEQRYVLRARIATGGMGEVWRARDAMLGREVAVKILKAEYAEDSNFRARFVNEARTAASLHHSGIAAVFDFGEGVSEEDTRPFLVMELVEGRPLAELLRDGEPMPPEKVRDLIGQVVTALAVAHAQGLVHRDIKPANLLLTPAGKVKITDFGIARAADGVALTRTGELVGTPSYLSPEQAEGRSATAASDVYSVGVVMYECLTGRRPFTADTPVAIALAHVRQPVPELPPQLPADLVAITTQALAKDPAQRYPDAGALAAALRGFTAESTAVLPSPVTASGAFAAPEPATAPATKRRPWLLIAAAGAVLVLLVGLGIALVSGGPDTPDPQAGPGTTPSGVAATTEPTRAESGVTLDPAAYLGKQVAQVRAALGALGLRTTVQRRTNPGGHRAGTVAGLDPSGKVARGATITLSVWRAPVPTRTQPAKPGRKQNGHPGKGTHGHGPKK